MEKVKERVLTTWEVLRLKFPANEYVLIEEVSNYSGFSRNRSLDYMLINLWESRGLAVTGIEKKSNRSDWLKELKQPEKQESHYKHCDYFYLLTDKADVAKLEEIPDTWGWYHINDKQILKTMKPAPKNKPDVIHRSLMCAMLRRAADKGKYVHVDTIETRIQEMAEKIKLQKDRQLEMDANNYKDLLWRVEEFEKASGVAIRRGWDQSYPKKVGEIVKLLLNEDVEGMERQFTGISNQCKFLSDSALKSLEIIKSYREQNKPAINQ